MRGSFVLMLVLLLASVIIMLFSLFYFLGIDSLIGIQFTAHASSQGTLSLFVEGDDTNPDVKIAYPEAATYTSHITSLNYTASDDSALSTCQYSLNQGVANTTIVCGTNVTGITSSTGSNIWTVYANDTSNNRNSSSVSFTVTISDAGGGAGGSAGGGGGGGSGTKKPALADFSISPEEFNVLIISGETETREFTVENTGQNTLVIDMEISGITGFASLSGNRLVLSSGQKENVALTLSAGESGVYAGRVILKSGNIRRDLFVLMNVRSKDALFDVSLILPESFRIISSGELLKVFVSLLQVGEARDVDASIRYLIKDFDGNTLSSESETFRIFREKSFVKDFPTSDLPVGDYIAGIEVTYPDGFAVSSAHFTVSKTKIDFWLIAVIIAIVLAGAVIAYSVLRYKKSRKSYKRVRKRSGR